MRFTTPIIPKWIKDLRVDGYRNIFAFELGQRNLYGTETLFGDWSCDLLLLAKDFAPTQVIEARIAGGDPTPYRHEQSLPTNKRLVKLASGYRGGILYASACFFLRDDGKWSGALPNRKAALVTSRRVFDFTIEHLPNLRAVACLGRDAWDFAVGRRNNWRKHMEARRPLITGSALRFFAHAHPGGLGTKNRGKENIVRDWAAMLNNLERSRRGQAA